MTKNSRQLSKYLRPLGDLSMVWVQGGDGQKKAQYLWCLTSVKAEFVIWSQWLWICSMLWTSHGLCFKTLSTTILWSNEFIDTSTNRTSDTASLFLAVSLECICNGFLDLRSTPVYVCHGFSNPSPVATLTPIGLLHRPSSPLHWHESSRTQPESINIVRELEKRNLQEKCWQAHYTTVHWWLLPHETHSHGFRFVCWVRYTPSNLTVNIIWRWDILKATYRHEVYLRFNMRRFNNSSDQECQHAAGRIEFESVHCADQYLDGAQTIEWVNFDRHWLIQYCLSIDFWKVILALKTSFITMYSRWDFQDLCSKVVINSSSIFLFPTSRVAVHQIFRGD